MLCAIAGTVVDGATNDPNGSTIASLYDLGAVVVSIAPVDDNLEELSLARTVLPPDYDFEFGDLPPNRYRVSAGVQREGDAWAASQIIDSGQTADDIVRALTPARDIKGMVPPGEWKLSVTPLPTGAFLKSARLGEKDVQSASIQLEPGSRNTLNILVSTNAGRVHGETDARAGILLTLSGDERYCTTVAPGKYKIFALENLSAEEFRNPDAAAQLESLGADIQVNEGATVEAHPQLISTDRAREALP